MPKSEGEFVLDDAGDLPDYRRVSLQLRRDIIHGTFSPGTWLRLQAIANRFGISVQPVREALQVLAGEGLIDIYPNRGARVRGLNRERIIHMYEVREAMESFLSRRFAEEASLKDLEQIEELQAQHDAAMAARDVGGASRINLIFHHTINKRAGNLDALNMCERYRELAHVLFKELGPASDHFERITREHHELLAAFKNRDTVAAQRLAGEHVRSTLKTHLLLFDHAQAHHRREDVYRLSV